MRFFGFVSIVLGFILLAFGVAQSAHAFPPTQWPERTFEVAGTCILLAGIGLTALAGRLATLGVSIKAGPPAIAPKSPVSVKFTTTKVFRVNVPGMTPIEGSTSGADSASVDLLKAVMAQLDDPAQASKMQIQGGDASQVKDQLKKILALQSQAEPSAATPVDAQAQRLRELDDLHVSGTIDDEQYQAIRAKLLGPQ